MILFKGYRHKGGVVHFRNITTTDLRQILFPKDFYEKFMYLGSVPYDLKEMEPLVVFMDYKARPWWCPRFVLRFLHVFGMDKSIVRVRSIWMANLLSRLTKGYRILDYKTKWEWYDLRISIQGDDQMWWLSDAIEGHYYREGKRQEENQTNNEKETVKD